MKMVEICTMDYLPGYKITKNLGIVFGSKVMNKALETDDNTNIEQLLDITRQEATSIIVEHALRRHATAIVNVRLTTTNLGNNMIECQVSGMAVKAEEINE